MSAYVISEVDVRDAAEALVFGRVDAIGYVPLAAPVLRHNSSQLTPWLSNTRMTP